MSDQFAAEVSKCTQSPAPARASLRRCDACKKKQDSRESGRHYDHDSALHEAYGAPGSASKPLDSSIRSSSGPGLGHSIHRIPVMASAGTTKGEAFQRAQLNSLSGISPLIQAKLAISQPGDALEQEADRIAEKVMAMPLSPPPQERAPLTQLQRSSAQAMSSPVPSIVGEVLRSPGAPLDGATRAFNEPRFGHDFSQVRVHADERAAESAQVLNAKAYTVGLHVVFGERQFAPETMSGRRLMTHELTHVVQQAKSLQRFLIQREISPVVSATNQQSGEFIQDAIRFLNQAANHYLLQRQTDLPRLDAEFDGITRMYTNNESILNTQLNNDPDLANRLKQAYENALRNLLQNGADLLRIPLSDQYFRYAGRIPSWVSWPDFSQRQGHVQINGTVGLDGGNAPSDVRAVQQRLVELGYLTLQEYVAERPADQPVQSGQAPVQVDIATIPRTMGAIRRFSQAAFGRPSLIITPAQASLTFLNAPLPQPRGRINIGADVGRGGTNNPADVLAVQQRLQAINLLSSANFQAELVAANAAHINENAISNTINAIGRLHRELAGSNLWIIRPDSREEEILNNPPLFRMQALEFSNSVGTTQNNAPADVRLLQDRLLNLAYLTQTHFDAEVIDPAYAANPAQILDNQIPHTIAALISFQVSRRLNGNGQLVPGSETHRMLIRPSLPTVMAGHLNARVGAGVGRNANINQPADVRMVQERLHELGFLSTVDFMSERADPAAGGNIAVAQLTHTIDAIREFQGLVVGRTDGYIDPGGMSLRILNDPTYGTLTTFNPEANNPQAGIAFGGTGVQALNRIIQAIERAEAGNLTGEVPAVLINAAGVPASFGRGQMIGRTALGVLKNPHNNQLRDQYGLDMASLNNINDRARETGNRYNAISRLVGTGGVTEANLQASYNTYIATNGAQFHADTGLFDQDIINMFRIAQIKRRIIAQPVVHGRKTDTTVINESDISPAVQSLLANPDFLASYNALGFNRGSLNAYVRRTDSLGENLAGFITKAIFSRPDSQGIRNAMTDAGGAAMGRMLIQQNFIDANAVVPAGQADRDRIVAAITAIIHNRGGTARNRYRNLADTLADTYVDGVLGIWRSIGAP